MVEVGEEHLAHDLVVGDLGFAQALDPVGSQADEEAAPVVGVGAAFEQAELGEAIDGSRDAAGAEVAPLSKLPNGHGVGRRRDERDQDAVGVDPEPVLGEQLAVKFAKDCGVDAQHPSPGAELLSGERVGFGWLLDGDGGIVDHNYLTCANKWASVCITQISYSLRGEESVTTTTAVPKALSADEGLRLQSGPGRDLVFKLTGEDTRDAFDYFLCEVAPHGGPPLHVHHYQDETIHVMSGRFKVRVGDQEHTLDRGGFAYLPAGLPHAFLNLTDQPAELIITFVPGGGHTFFEELAPATRTATPDRAEVAAIFERHGMSLVGPPLSAD